MDPTGSGRIGRRTNGVTIGGMPLGEQHPRKNKHHSLESSGKLLCCFCWLVGFEARIVMNQYHVHV